jgi:PASTA domain/Domain of unknown function DUF11
MTRFAAAATAATLCLLLTLLFAGSALSRSSALQADAALTLDRSGGTPLAGRDFVVTTGIESRPGPGAAFSFVLTVDLPAGVTFIRSSPGLPAAIPCEVATQTVTCRGRYIGGDLTASVSLTLRANTAGTYDVSGVVALEGEADTDPTNNSAVLEVVVAPAPPPARPRCLVPRLRGKTLAQARRLIVAAGCRLGTTSSRYDSRIPRGRVSAQRPAAGVRVARGARVAVVLSRGPR